MGVCADTLLFVATISTVIHLISVGRAIDTQTLNEELIDACDLSRIIINSRKVELFSSLVLQPLLSQFFDKSSFSYLLKSFVVLSLERFKEVLDMREKVAIEMFSPDLLCVEVFSYMYTLRNLWQYI